MIPKRVTLENFLSFGRETTIAFDDDEPLWVLGGPNGVGKSAVFDAMTYCLFGAHRGGIKGMDNLTHHGANGFRVSFEFEFKDVLYRITRSRYGGKSPNIVEHRLGGGDWTRVPNLNAAGDASKWTEETLGLDYKSFQASVLLRQGKADDIVEAKPTKRFEILRGIIGSESYEALGDLVSIAEKEKSDSLKKLKQRRDNATLVTAEEVSAAAAGEAGARKEKGAAAERAQAALEHRGHAKNWNDLRAALSDHGARIGAAELRAKEAENIRADHDRAEVLASVLPILDKLIPKVASAARLAASLPDLRLRAGESQLEVSRLTEENTREADSAKAHKVCADQHERDAKELRKEAAQKERFRAAATGLAALAESLRRFPDSLDGDAIAAKQRRDTGNVEHRRCRDELAAAKSELAQAEARRKKVESLEIGVTCFECGQEVKADHAEKERRAAAAAMSELSDTHRLAEDAAKLAAAELAAAEGALLAFQASVVERDGLRRQHADQTRSLQQLGATPDLAELVREIGDLTSRAAQSETARAEAERAFQDASEATARLKIELAWASSIAQQSAKALSDAEAQIDRDRLEYDLLRGQLPAKWPSTDAMSLVELHTEWEALTSSNISERFTQLQKESALLEEWRAQRANCEGQIADIPIAARISMKDSDAALQTARSDADLAEKAWQSAHDTTVRVTREFDDFTKLCREIEGAENEHRIHKRLDELLGKKGLQRELVREAERQIAAHANLIVGQLSDGDLSLSLDPAPATDDEALKLLVRLDDDPIPIEVEYLSGSQKFRVAVALALAIGQFASGQTRPLECVIIDEGFGSLDKDGLRAAAEELNRLKQHLKRIILVSHQEEFTDHFPVVIQLKKTEDGVSATTVRR